MTIEDIAAGDMPVFDFDTAGESATLSVFQRQTRQAVEPIATDIQHDNEHGA